MTLAQGTDELRGLLDHLERSYEAPPDGADRAGSLAEADPVLAAFLYSYLLWETTSSKALIAVKRLDESLVDVNELRICLPNEISQIIGERYSRSRERALRLKATLNDIFAREHAVSLVGVQAMGKRDAKDYLDTLEGIPSFVASRVVLLALGGHAAPVDARLSTALVRDGVVESGSDVDSVSNFLERRLRSKELLSAYGLLQAWSDDGGPSVSGSAGKKRAKTTKPRRTK